MAGQVHEVPYGSLEYIIRLELRKRSMANRVIVIITSICVLGTTIVLLIVATVRIAQDRRTHAELLIFLLELAMQVCTRNQPIQYATCWIISF